MHARTLFGRLQLPQLISSATDYAKQTPRERDDLQEKIKAGMKIGDTMEKAIYWLLDNLFFESELDQLEFPLDHIDMFAEFDDGADLTYVLCARGVRQVLSLSFAAGPWISVCKHLLFLLGLGCGS